MTTRNKKSTTAADVDPKDVKGAQADVASETKGDEQEGYPTFTVEVDGREIELEDRWESSASPVGMMFVFHERYAQKYIPGVLEQIIGEDQVFTLIESGLAVDDLQKVFEAWGERRQGK